MKDYLDLYLKCDVYCWLMFLKTFRKNNLKNYGSSPIHYLNVPALSWDAMLDMTEVELELLSDAGMFIFFKNGVRVGVCYIFDRYGKANNNYSKSYNPKQESKNILYLDANNLDARFFQ